jgi:CheY-like chemotaxis protein/nitrogen-specific signal transduction histidine kinase
MPSHLRKTKAVLIDELEAARQRITELEVRCQDKSEFLAKVSHEIWTPLNGIMGTLAVLEQGDLSVEQRELVGLARNSSRSLLNVMTGILDASLLETGRMELRDEKFTVSGMLASLHEALDDGAKRKGIVLHTHIQEDVPSLLVGDGRRIEQILLNLAGNAVKSTEQGEVNVRIGTYLNEAAGAGYFVLMAEVSDTGGGIPGDRLDAVFEPFMQMDGTYTRKYAGTGLELNVAKRLVDLLGGTLDVESESGKGTTIRVSLLVETSNESVSAPLAGSSTVTVRRLNILLAEDDPTNQYATRRILENQGHTVACAARGEEVLDVVKAQRFDVILMDIEMPGMDGIEATRCIREVDSGVNDPEVCIVALTAHTMPEDRDRFVEAGMSGFIAKPIDVEELRKALARITVDAA